MRTFYIPKLKDPLQVAAFYSFTPLSDEIISSLLCKLNVVSSQKNVKGTVLIASEGINGTVCGPKDSVAELIFNIKKFASIKDLNLKYSWTSGQAFRRFKVRRKPEIVTMGVNGVNPRERVGSYVEPSKWNNFLDDPETLVIDTRNKYEIVIGGFHGAINPQTDNFRQFPSWVDKSLSALVKEKSAKRIAMFCTGGIRCEKATSLLKDKGFNDVHHLSGGILSYIENIPKEENRWNGECFVFDQRVSVNNSLEPGIHTLCYACGMPLSPKDRLKSDYLPGVQCHYCLNKFTSKDRERFSERQKQYEQRYHYAFKNSF